MVDVEKVSGRYRHSNPIGDLKSSAGAFACDLLELAELQGKLFQADAKAAVHQSVGLTATLFVACSFLLGCLPVAVFGLASALAYFCEIETWVAQLVVGGGLSFLSVLVAAIAVKKLSKISQQFKRSSDELAKNLKWTKNVINGVNSR